MNCKPGDLAVVIKSTTHPEHIGKIVIVTKDAGIIAHKGSYYQFWHTDPELKGRRRRATVVADVTLRPIRDNPGEDEMLRIVGKPTEVVAS